MEWNIKYCVERMSIIVLLFGCFLFKLLVDFQKAMRGGISGIFNEKINAR